MSEGENILPIDKIREQIVKVKPNIEGNVSAESESLEPTVTALKSASLVFVRQNSTNASLIERLNKHEYIDGIVAEMRHIPGGQEFALLELQKLKPDICWYRGGTLTKFRDSIGSSNVGYFSDQDLNTEIIDGGANGVLGRPSLALSYLEVTTRENPVLYSLTLDALITGLTSKAISLTSEHNYDLNVIKGEKGWIEYLDFCRKNLKIQRVALDQK